MVTVARSWRPFASLCAKSCITATGRGRCPSRQDHRRYGRRGRSDQSSGDKPQDVDMKAYQQIVEAELKGHFDTNPTLKKIRAGEPVSEADIQAPVSLILIQSPNASREVLKSSSRKQRFRWTSRSGRSLGWTRMRLRRGSQISRAGIPASRRSRRVFSGCYKTILPASVGHA